VVYLKTEDLMRSTFRLEGAALEDYRAYAGEGVFRLSIGLESADDIIADLDRALEA
jgi:cystathionine gamma-synthase